MLQLEGPKHADTLSVSGNIAVFQVAGQCDRFYRGERRSERLARKRAVAVLVFLA